ncbi:MAG: Ig-like domain-containing protein [Panacibacter sp.]
MKKIYSLLFVITCFVCSISLITGTGCANIIPPTGGPRDSLPPVLMNALPKDSTVNFKGNKITLTFDEYIQLDNNLNDMLVVSPNPERIPAIEGKLRTVTIKLKDSLRPNTTYSFNFGKALKDINENNVLRNFTYVFSTGDKLADGMITGNVKLAETGDVDSQLLVVLHSNLNDSAIKKLKSDYYTRIDSSGNFRFNYLPNEKFMLYVLPNDYSKKYDDSTKMFAFYNEPIEAGPNPSSVQLYAYQEFKQQTKPAISSGSDSKSDQKEEDKRLKYTLNLESSEQDLLDSLKFILNRPVAKFDSSLVLLTDTGYQPIKNYSILQSDTTAKKFAIIYKWPEDQPYKLIVQKAAFTDSAGITLSKSDTISFKTKRESQYGSVRLHFINLDLSKNPVLQLVQNKVIVQSVILTSNEWYQKLFEPGQYEMHILFDNNKNGIWEPGNFDAKLQPEIVQKIKRPLITKANWDNEIDINL